MKKKLKDRIKNTIKEVKDALLREDKYLANELERSVGEVRQQFAALQRACLLYTSPSPRDQRGSRMPSSA